MSENGRATTLTILQSADERPLTKTIEFKDNQYIKSAYSNTFRFVSKTIEVPSLLRFKLALDWLESDQCLLKGNLTKPLEPPGKSRAGLTNSHLSTDWVCLDLDRITGVSTGWGFLQQIGIKKVSFIQQLSSSSVIPGSEDFSAHLFLRLKEPMLPDNLKLWLKWLNLTNPFLSEQLTLAKSGCALKWPLDITTCQNDKLLYVAPPICIGFEPEPVERIAHYQEAYEKLDIDMSLIEAPELLHLERTKIAELRKAKDLPKKKLTVNAQGVIHNPDPAIVTGVKEERDFVYLNLNGGDSWGYYFPVGNPEIIYNFKGEPNYRLKDISPAFYDSYVENQAPEPQDGVVYAVGRDLRADTYLCIKYDRESKELDWAYTGARANTIDFMKQHGQNVPDYLPTWEVVCDFFNTKRVDFEKRIINRYNPGKYQREATEPPSLEIPETIKKVIDHVFNYDEECIEHFLNWIAVILQRKMMCYTAWVIGGTQGTGKGLLFDKVLTPIFGDAYCGKAMLSSFEQEFNGFLKDRLLLFVDEVQISEIKKRGSAMARVKEAIAAERIIIREMRMNPVEMPNRVNFIFASNKFDAIEIDPEDRRFNVSPRQEIPLKEVCDIFEIEIAIAAELQDFTNYLLYREADINKARTVLDTEERQRLMSATENTTMSIANRIREGNFEYFLNTYLEAKDLTTDFAIATKIKNSISFLQVLTHMHAHRGRECKMPRDYLAVLFYYTAGIAKGTAHAFTKFLGYHGFNIKTMYFGENTVRGVIIKKIEVTDEAEQQWIKHIHELPGLKVV